MRLDLIRGLAALLVVVSHAFVIFLERPAHASLPWRGFVRAANLGHEAVLAFFVLSGFLVAHTTYERPGWLRYAVSRASRILVVFWPALLLGAAVDLVGRRALGGAMYTGGHPHWWFGASMFREGLTAVVAMKNAVFLGGIHAPVLGSNVPLWSLAYEVWYYVAFPAVVVAISPPTRARQLLAGGVLVAIALLLGRHGTGLFSLWLLGAAAASARRGGRREVLMILALASIAAAVALLDPVLRRMIIRDLVVGSVVAAFVLFAARGKGTSTLAARASRPLAQISFSLYLVHMPALVFLAALWRVPPRATLSLGALGRPTAAIAIAVLYGAIVWFAIERHTPRVRAWIEHRFTA